MAEPAIFREDWEADPRLAELFTVTRKAFWRVQFAAASARADFQPHHPSNGAGLLSYIYGTGALRDLLCTKKSGFEINRSKNIESAYHPKTKRKVIFQNVESACGEQLPRPISNKGAASAEAVNGQAELFPELAEKDANALVWYYCAGMDNTAELLRPKSIEDGQFKGYHERIWIVRPGEWADVDLSDFEGGTAADFDVEISRKDKK
jgi:hypothetical protein